VLLVSTYVDTFKRELRNTESQYRRMDSGELTGRNADGSADRLNWKLNRLRELARTDEVCDALDADDKLAARWNRVERRAAGLK
jgi:hypothetical protein